MSLLMPLTFRFSRYAALFTPFSMPPLMLLFTLLLRLLLYFRQALYYAADEAIFSARFASFAAA